MKTIIHLIKTSRPHKFIITVLICGLFPCAINAQFAGGDGSPENPWQIATAEQLDSLRHYPDSAFVLIADIDLSEATGEETGAFWNSGSGWLPINFSGSLNGNGHTITGLFINRPSSDFVGLFGLINNGGKVDSLGLVGVNITGGDHSVGGLAGWNAGTIRFSYTTGTVSAESNVGGLVGQNREEFSSMAGGGRIIDSYSTANVCCNQAGGLVSLSGGGKTAIIRSYATGHVTGNSSGGLATHATDTVIANYWNTETAGQTAGDGTGSIAITGLTTNEMTQEASFSNWDFTENGTWSITEGLSYPWLQWQGNPAGYNIPHNFPPMMPKVLSEDQQVSLVWNSPVYISSLTTLEGYNIYRDSVKVNNSLLSDTMFTDTGLINLEEYRYNITAVYDSSGTITEVSTADTLAVKPNIMAGGLGTEESPWQVTNAEQLYAIRNAKDAHYILTVDIDLTTATGSPGGDYWNSGLGWEPIGGTGTSGFSGSLNGDGHTIIGLFINRPIPNKVAGMIGTLDNGGRVENLGLAKVSITGDSHVGSLVGEIWNGSISNIFATGSVSGNSVVGGLIGINNSTGTVTSSYASVRVSGNSNVGSLAGINSNLISGSYWNTETGGQANGIGSDFETSTVTGLTTAQMLDPDNFSGFNFESKWDIYEGFSFPFLRGESSHRSSVAQITGSENWHLMSSPFDNISYGELLKDIWTQGFPGSDSPDHGTPNVLTWNETTGTFEAISSADDIPGKGFIVYVFGDDDYDQSEDSTGFPKNLIVEGEEDTATVIIPLSYTNAGVPEGDGWNLVGNPYGSSVDWDAENGWTKSNIDKAFYVWNNEAGEYQSWNGETGTFSGEGLIAAWQGFWVKANAADPSLTFTDEVRSSGGFFYKGRAKETVPQIHFELSGNEASSQTVIMFSEEAKLQKDAFDAYKLQSLNSEYLSLYSLMDDSTALDINALPVDLNAPLEIDLDVAGSSLTSEFELKWKQDKLPENWSIILTDNVSGTEIDLNEHSEYSFEVKQAQSPKVLETLEDSPESQDRNFKPELLAPKVIKASTERAKSTGESGTRFTLTISSQKAVSNEPGNELPTEFSLSQNYPNPFNPRTVISYQLPVNSTVNLEVFDIMGRKVATLVDGEAKSAGVHEVTFDADYLASGMYIYRLTAGNHIFNKKLTLIK